MAEHLRLLGLVIELDIVNRSIGEDNAISARRLATQRLNILIGNRRLDRTNAATVELMQTFRAPLVDFVLCRRQIARKAVAVAIMIDRGGEHLIFANRVAVLVGKW